MTGEYSRGIKAQFTISIIGWLSRRNSIHETTLDCLYVMPYGLYALPNGQHTSFYAWTVVYLDLSINSPLGGSEPKP